MEGSDQQLIRISPLRAVQNEITNSTGFSSEVSSLYLMLFGKWFRRKLTFAEFDRRAQHLIPIELHSKFVVTASHFLDQNQFGPSSSTLFGSIPQTSASSTALSPSDQSGLINAKLLLKACEFRFDEVDRQCAPIVQKHIRNHIANLLEAVLRLCYPFKVTESGFAHSFGIHHPAKCKNASISAEDLLDCVNLEKGLISWMDLRMLLVSLLKNAVLANQSRRHRRGDNNGIGMAQMSAKRPKMTGDDGDTNG